MSRHRIFILVVLLAASTLVDAQTVLKTFDLSKDFNNIAGTPRVVRNAFEHNWAAAWRQQGSPAKIFGRIIESDGTLKSPKTLVKKVSDSPQSFDIFPDSVNYTYLLAYETSAKQLKVQLYTGTLAKKGTATTIDTGFTGTIPRLAFNGTNKQFLLFWLSDNRTTLKGIVLDATGKPAGAETTLREAAGGATFESLNVSTNQDTGNLLVTILQVKGNTGQLLGVNVKPNGKLLRAKATLITPAIAQLNTFPDAAFTDSGTGFSLWRDGTKIQRRKISKTGAVASSTKSLAGAADGNSIQTGILFDQKHNLFVGAWTEANSVRSFALNSSTGAVDEDTFTVANSIFAGSLNPSVSYDGQVGNVIVVWEDTTGGSAPKFRVRAALFFIDRPSPASGISIGDNFYTSANGTGNISINAGDTVTWTNNGNAFHTVTSTTSLFDSGSMGHGETFSFRFNDPGDFPYFCTIHGQATMSGTIHVNSGGEPPPRY